MFTDDPLNCKSHVGSCDPMHCAPWCGESNDPKCFESNRPPSHECCDKTGECNEIGCPYNCENLGTKPLFTIQRIWLQCKIR